jgi:hypothetical protein
VEVKIGSQVDKAAAAFETMDNFNFNEISVLGLMLKSKTST